MPTPKPESALSKLKRQMYSPQGPAWLVIHTLQTCVDALHLDGAVVPYWYGLSETREKILRIPADADMREFLAFVDKHILIVNQQQYSKQHDLDRRPRNRSRIVPRPREEKCTLVNLKFNNPMGKGKLPVLKGGGQWLDGFHNWWTN
jgi:hypothetical protein